MLISINPKHIENIFNGTKKYEYRKIKCKREIKKIIYSTYPIMKVVGEAKVEKYQKIHQLKYGKKQKNIQELIMNFIKTILKIKKKLQPIN